MKKPLMTLGTLATSLLLSAAISAQEATAKSGETVYNSSCGTCHNTGVSGAPKLGDAADWSARLATSGESGLLEHSIKGYKAMPAKGLCFACSDEELAAAVRYILERSQ